MNPPPPNPKKSVASRKVIAKDAIPAFFDSMDAKEMQRYLIRHDASGEISHLIVVPLHRLSRYVNDPSIPSSDYLWRLRSLKCVRLRRICSRLGRTQSSFRNGTGTAECLKAILQQPGNRTFHWNQYRSRSATTTRHTNPRPMVDPVVSSPNDTAVPLSARHAESRIVRASENRCARVTARRVVETGTHGDADTTSMEHTVAPSTPMAGRLNWDTWAHVTEQHRRSIEQQRNQEFAYYRALNTGMIHDEVRRRMLRTVETIQQSIRSEERALERWQAHFFDGVTRATMKAAAVHPTIPPVTPPVAHDKTTDWKTGWKHRE
jgi:hypothetical protein